MIIGMDTERWNPFSDEELQLIAGALDESDLSAQALGMTFASALIAREVSEEINRRETRHIPRAGDDVFKWLEQQAQRYELLGDRARDRSQRELANSNYFKAEAVLRMQEDYLAYAKAGRPIWEPEREETL